MAVEFNGINRTATKLRCPRSVHDVITGCKVFVSLLQYLNVEILYSKLFFVAASHLISPLWFSLDIFSSHHNTCVGMED